jgi:protein TonB
LPPEFSSLFDAVDTPAEAPLIPEGIAALSEEADDVRPRSAPAGAVDETPVDSGPVLVEARPLYRENPPPEYPRLARRRGYEGTVLLEVLVDEAGRVKELKLAESSGHAALDRAAEKSVGRWRFTAGRRGEDPVEMWVKVPVRFELR